MKPIKHNHSISITVSFEEDGDIEQIDHYLIKITQHSPEDDGNDVSATIDLTNIIESYEENSYGFINAADSQNQDIYEAASLVFSDKNSNSISKLLQNDSMDFVSSFIYIDKMVIPKEFDMSSIAPALSMALKKINKGIDPLNWACAVFNKQTFFDTKENELDIKITNSILKDLGFKEISKKDEKKVGLDQDSPVLIVGGQTLNNNLDFDPEYKFQQESKISPQKPDILKIRENLNTSTKSIPKNNNH